MTVLDMSVNSTVLALFSVWSAFAGKKFFSFVPRILFCMCANLETQLKGGGRTTLMLGCECICVYVWECTYVDKNKIEYK
jgi:hypothetical protein